MTHEEVLDEINIIYERLSHPEDCENGVYSFRDGNYLEALEILIDYYEVGIIKELEQLKADIKEASYDRLDGFNGGQMVVDWEDIEDMFYDHISNLKGEQECQTKK